MRSGSFAAAVELHLFDGQRAGAQGDVFGREGGVPLRIVPLCGEHGVGGAGRQPTVGGVDGRGFGVQVEFVGGDVELQTGLGETDVAVAPLPEGVGGETEDEFGVVVAAAAGERHFGYLPAAAAAVEHALQFPLRFVFPQRGFQTAVCLDLGLFVVGIVDVEADVFENMAVLRRVNQHAAAFDDDTVDCRPALFFQ